MENDIISNLASMGLTLPAASRPKGSYNPASRSGNLVFTAGQIPLAGDNLLATGRIGSELTEEVGYSLSRTCGLAALAAVGTVADINSITRVVKVLGFVASAPGFTRQASVVNGASDLFVDLLGDRGKHARSVVGVDRLPLNAPVEIEIIVEVRD